MQLEQQAADLARDVARLRAEGEQEAFLTESQGVCAQLAAHLAYEMSDSQTTGMAAQRRSSECMTCMTLPLHHPLTLVSNVTHINKQT